MSHGAYAGRAKGCPDLVPPLLNAWGVWLAALCQQAPAQAPAELQGTAVV